MNASQPSVGDGLALIHRESVGAECLVVSAVTQWEQGAPVARFLESLGVTPESTRSTRLGRVEVEIAGRDEFDRVRRNAVSEHAATEHREPGFSYVEARIEGVPVQFWSAVTSW